MWLLRFFMRCKGSVSLFLSIILTPTLLLVSVLVDLANRNMSKAAVEEAGELAASSVLSKYDSVLEDVYGLFAISQDYDDLSKNVEQYMKDTLSASGFTDSASAFSSKLLSGVETAVQDYFGAAKEEATSGLIRVELSNVSASGVGSASLYEPAVLENQIVEFMKYRGPTEIGLDLLSTLGAFKTLNAKTEVADKKAAVDEEQSELGELCAELFGWLFLLDVYIDNIRSAEPDWNALDKNLKEANRIVTESVYGTADLSDCDLFELSGTHLYDKENSSVNIGKSKHDLYDLFTEESKNRLTDLEDITDLMSESAEFVSDLAERYDAYMTTVRKFIAYDEYLDNKISSLKKKLKREEKKEEPNQDTIDELDDEIDEYKKIRNDVESALDDIEDMLDESDICQKLRNYEKIVAAAYERLLTSVKKADDKLKPFAESVNELAGQQSFFPNPERIALWMSGEGSVNIPSILNLITKIENKLDDLKTANDNFEISVAAYINAEAEDSFALSMEADVKKNDNALTKESLQELKGQLNCINTYIMELDKKLDDGAFYSTKIPLEKNLLGKYPDGKNIGSKARNLLTSAAKSNTQFAPGSSGLSERAYTAYVTIMNEHQPERSDSYLKRIFETVTVNGETIPVPECCLYLALQFGGKTDGKTEEGKNLEKNLKNTVSESTKDAGKSTAESTAEMQNDSDSGSGASSTKDKAPFGYSYTIFDDLSDMAESGELSGSGPVQVESTDQSGAIRQFRSMAGLVTGMLGVLKNIISDWEGIRDDLLITEYIYQNFSSYYLTTEGFTKEAEKKGSSNTLIHRNNTYYPTSMTGIMISPENNVLYGCEMEYILYGYRGKEGSGFWFWKKDPTGPSVNVDTVKGNIYAIRLVCNSIFALTDGTLNSQVLPAATAISAATMGAFPEPVAAVVLKLALAMLETQLDMTDIMDGKKVALIKNSKTWNCSVSNMIYSLKEEAVDAAADMAKELVSKGVYQLSGKLQDAISGTLDYASDSAINIAESITDDVQNTLEGMVQETLSGIGAAVISEAESIIAGIFSGNAAEYVSDEQLERDIKARIQSVIDSAIENLPVSETIRTKLKGIVTNAGAKSLVDQIWDSDRYLVMSSGDYNTVKKLMIGGQEATFGQVVLKLTKAALDPAGTANELVEGVMSQAVGAVTYSINNVLSNSKSTLMMEFKNLLNDMTTELKVQSQMLINAGAQNLTETVDECIDNISNTVSDTLSEAFPNSASTIVDPEKTNAEVPDGDSAKTFEAGYNDYLIVFLFLEISDDKTHDAVIQRIGEVITLNLRNGLKTYKETLGITDSAYKDSKFLISNAYPYISISAQVKLKPFLLSQKLISGDMTEELVRSNVWNYSYGTVAGY